MSGHNQLWRLSQKALDNCQRLLEFGLFQIALNRAGQRLFCSIDSDCFAKLNNATTPGQRLEIHYHAVSQFWSERLAHLEFKAILTPQPYDDASFVNFRFQQFKVSRMGKGGNSKDDEITSTCCRRR